MSTVVFVVIIIAWTMLYYTPSLESAVEPEDSLGANIARIFAPLLYPIGLNYDQSWMMAHALMIGFLAKEAVVIH